MRHILFGLILTATSVNAQDDALQTLNAHFQGTVVFTIDHRDRLVAELSDANGPYRRDMAYFDLLDTTAFAYDAEEHVVMVRCKTEQARCIDKEIIKTGAVGPTGRMSLPVPAGDPEGAKALRLLTELVRGEQLALQDGGTGTKRKKVR